ncbi:Flp pilus assembly protein TadD [Caulobacter ginsengisoli]|uniref:Flp pilus assembly protein TadD n=1 Tax=Caulobacter ginsengisoli TaxID=400775 RepID=A0ABU0IR39_9CAUL|nr:tetratricopeptide repeat protein [Caulobacter ginsengisoli]MDQ0464434.1 Flp pilus assembly protein TadD [Caulobacter ginsengisoli]
MVLKSRVWLAAAAVVALGAGSALASGGGGGGGGDMPSSTAPSYDPVVEYQKGIDALKAENWKLAERSFSHVTEVAPKAPEAWSMLGMARYRQNDFKGARKAFEKAVKLAPNDIVSLGLLGVTQAKIGDAVKAQATLADLKTRQATCADKCPEAATLKAAVSSVEQALAPAPVATPAASLTLPALPAFRPMDGDKLYLAAVSLINEGRYGDALASLDQASLVLGPHPDVLTYQGYSWRKLGQLDRAEDYYRQALAIAPDHRGATEYYGELKVVRGDLSGARAMLARLEKQCVYGCAEVDTLRRWIAAGGDPG